MFIYVLRFLSFDDILFKQWSFQHVWDRSFKVLYSATHQC